MKTNGKRNDYLFKIVLIGDAGVGKSQILNRIAKNEFQIDSKSTIGVEFSTRKLVIDNCNVTVQVWDTAGQERQKAISSVFQKGAQGAIIVYDTTRVTTFDNVEKWYNEVADHEVDGVRLMLVGNKVDLKQLRDVPIEEGEKLAKKQKMTFNECSALKNANIEDSFIKIVRDILREKMDNGNVDRKKSFKSSKLLDDISKEKQESSGCGC